MEEIKIIIVAHKKYRMPEDAMYLPVHAGAEGKDLELGYQKDNEGENISSLNPQFCELTGLYWAWKNLDAKYIGLAHYRRHFSMKKKSKDPFDNVLKYEEIRPFLGKIKIFTPNKRRYYIETLYSHYKHTHFSWHLDETRKILEKKYPEYVPYFDKVVKRTYGYMFNMMIMEKSYLDAYCEWIFDILFEFQKLDIPEMTSFHNRFYGRISEIVFNVWLEYQLDNGKVGRDEVKELKCIHMEKVHWTKKITSFLKAKFFGKKYESSF